MLRYLVPGATGPIVAISASSWTFMRVVALGGVATAAAGCLGLLAGPGVGVALTCAGLLLSLAAAAIHTVRRFRMPGRWVVTTRRVVFTRGAHVAEVRLAALTGVDAASDVASLTLSTAGGEHVLEPVEALGELWGAVHVARAWSVGHLDVDTGVTVHPMAAWWATAKAGLTVIRGVLVLRPGYVAWVPEQVTRSGAGMATGLAMLLAGAKLRQVTALPPLDRIINLLQSLRNPDEFDGHLADLIDRWDGWRRPITAVDWSVTPTASGPLVTVRVDGMTYAAPTVTHVDWPAIEAAWRASRPC